MKELIRNYEIQSDTLLKVIQHPESTEDEILRASVARRFVRDFINDLQKIKLQHKEEMKSFGDYCRTGILNIDYSVDKLENHLRDWEIKVNA